MPRVSKAPRYYASKKAWYATLGGETILLVRGTKKATEKVAKEKYDAEVAARKVEVEGDRSTVWAVLNAYLIDLQARVRNNDASPGLLRMHTYFLTMFNDACGKTVVRNLRPQHVTEWVSRMKVSRHSAALGRTTVWGESTEKMARATINRAFNWAVEEPGLISANPLKRIGAGKKRKRQKRKPVASRVAITDHEHALLLEQATRRSCKDFFCLLKFLYGTGARPAEMYGVTAAEWDENKKAFRIRAAPENHGRYKLAHLGEDHLLYIPDDLVPLARELMTTYPSGTLFRNESGKPWKTSTLCARMKSIKQAANRAAKARGEQGVRKAVTAYGYRHAFVTRWVIQGRNMQKLCQLLNTSEAMVKEHYSHLFEEVGTLRDELNALT